MRGVVFNRSRKGFLLEREREFRVVEVTVEGYRRRRGILRVVRVHVGPFKSRGILVLKGNPGSNRSTGVDEGLKEERSIRTGVTEGV